MRLGGGGVLHHEGDPEAWIRNLRAVGHSASGAPLPPGSSDDDINRFREAAEANDIVIAEVGAWSNPISPDGETAKAAREKCISCLAHAEQFGARCCVNITGSRNPEKWDGPDIKNFSRETFEMIVEVTRQIVDAVKPTRTYYTLEAMPWIFPSSPDEYLALLEAIDRDRVAVHLDPVNMINSPNRYCNSGAFIRECFAKLGPMIRSCHAKDILIEEKLTVHMSECRPGVGQLDFDVYLRELSKLDPDTPLTMEHLPFEEYAAAAEHLRSVASRNQLHFK